MVIDGVGEGWSGVKGTEDGVGEVRRREVLFSVAWKR